MPKPRTPSTSAIVQRGPQSHAQFLKLWEVGTLPRLGSVVMRPGVMRSGRDRMNQPT